MGDANRSEMNEGVARHGNCATDDATMRRRDVRDTQVGTRERKQVARTHDVSHTVGRIGTGSGCRISRPISHRGQRRASTPVSASKHSTQVCGASP